MPIRPENKARYPKAWKVIRARIMNRAENSAGWPCCEHCGVANYARGYRLSDGEFDDTGGLELHEGKLIKIILTVAHLDHTPENCSDENLRALCQKCHNRHDAQTRADGIRARRRTACASGDLFQCQEASVG